MRAASPLIVGLLLGLSLGCSPPSAAPEEGADAGTADAAGVFGDEAGNGLNGPTGDGSRVALSDFSAAYAQTICAKIYDCCTEADRVDHLGLADDLTRAQCEQAYDQFYAEHFTLLVERAQQAGRAEYLPSQAAKCFDALDVASCEIIADRHSPTAECSAFVRPLVEPGGECVYNFECNRGICAETTTDFRGRVVEPGSCQPLPEMGEHCPDYECGDDAYCKYDYTARNGFCTSPEPDGAACTFDAACASEHCVGAGDEPGHPGTCAPAPTYCTGA